MAPNIVQKKTMASMRAPVRGRSSTIASPTHPITSTPTSARSLTVSSSNCNSGISGTSILTGSVVREPNLHRPSLPNMSVSTSYIPVQKTLTKDTALVTSRPSNSIPRLNTDKSDTSLSTSHIARPSCSLSSRSYSLSSPRLGSSSRFGDHPKPALTLSSTSSNSPSLIAKPVSRTQKPSVIKPPSIVTKSNSMNGLPSTQKVTSLPPIAPSLNPQSVQTPQMGTSGTLSTLPSSNIIPLSIPVPVTSPVTRSKNRIQAEIDSACFMTRSGSSESLITSSPSSSASSTPTIVSTPTMAGLTATSTAAGSEISIGNLRKPISRRPSASDLCNNSSTQQRSPLAPSSFVSTSKSSKTISTSSSTESLASLNGASPLKTSALSLRDRRESISASEASTLCTTSPETKTTTNSMADNIRRCQCPPPLEFPENVKREMKYEELEHRRRESELYAKIIELQIENANLKGDKETLSRVVSHRDKMLMEIRVQLQAMEFFCRENNIKVDIEMCSDEVIENWSFKESDEIYQRILLITQDLLRAGSKCLQENMASCRSGSQQQRSTRSSSSSSTSKLMSTDHARTNKKDNIVAGLSESVQLVTTSDQGGDAVLFKETSRPGTVKLDLQSLLKAEQEFNGTKDNKSTVSYSNLAEINAGIAERNGRRALDDGDYRSTFFRPRHDDEDDSSDDEDEGDDGDESQESEFEELGEDMIKYVELQPSVGPRRDSRSSSFSRMAAMTPYGGSSVSTPDMSTAVLMKNLWSNGAARQSSATTPLQHPSHQMQHRRSGSTNRSSGGSILSNGSLIEEYFTNGPHSMEQASSFGTLAQSTAAPIGLGMAGLPRTPERISIESFSAPPTGALPSVPTPRYSPVFSPSCSPPAPNHLYSYAARSPLSNSTSAMFHSQVSSSMMGGSKRNSNRSSSSSINRPFQSPPPPPMAPIPPLPTYPRLSHREQTKQGLLESKRSFRGRTVSHGFAIEDVGQFLERKTYGKLLTRDPMHQGHRRQISV